MPLDLKWGDRPREAVAAQRGIIRLGGGGLNPEKIPYETVEA